MSFDHLLGKVYDRESYNCAHLVADAWKIETGEDITNAVVGFLEPRREATGLRQFRRLDKPQSPCIVMMRHGIARPHVAIFVRGKILQIRESGVSMLPPEVATLGYTKIRYYS